MHEIRRNPHKSKLTNCFNDLVKSFMKMFKQSDQLDCHMTVYERSLFLVSTLFYQHVTESGKFKPWVLLRVTQTHEFWVMHVLIFGPLSMSNHTHTLTWITPWIEYVTFVSVVMSVFITPDHKLLRCHKLDSIQQRSAKCPWWWGWSKGKPDHILLFPSSH